MPRGVKSSKEGLGFSRRSNLQNSMAAVSTGISKLISLQGSLVQPLSCFHASDSTPLAPACKGETTHHGISSLAAARPVPTASHPHGIAAISLGEPRDQKQHKTSAERRSTRLPLPCVQPPSQLAGIFCFRHNRARKQE